MEHKYRGAAEQAAAADERRERIALIRSGGERRSRLSGMALGEQPTRLRIWRGESPLTVSCPKRTVSISGARGGNDP